MNTPDKTTAAAFPRYSTGEVIADSAALHWPGFYARRYRHPRVVDRFLVPATPEPLISCCMEGSAEFREREIGENWVTRHIGKGHIFITRAKSPYEVRFRSPLGEELDVIQLHIAVEPFLSALEASYPGKTDEVEVIDFSGYDAALSHLCFACAEMLAAKAPGNSRRISDLTHLLASYLVEKYTNAIAGKAGFRGGLPIRQIRQIEDYVREHLAEDISVEALASVTGLSVFHFSREFKHATGMSPLQYVTRERISRAETLIRETSRSIIDIGMDIGYTSPSYFSKVFARIVGVTPTAFRNSL